jgi:hypothetical protein
MSKDEKYVFLFINNAAPKIQKKFAVLCGRTGRTCLPPALNITMYKYIKTYYYMKYG